MNLKSMQQVIIYKMGTFNMVNDSLIVFKIRSKYD